MAVIIKQVGQFTYVHADESEVGWFAQTGSDDPAKRWHWKAGGTSGYATDRRHALQQVQAQIPQVQKWARTDAARKAWFDALPPHLQELWSAVLKLDLMRTRIWNRNPFDRAAYDDAYNAWVEASEAYVAAERVWLKSQTQKEAA